MRINNGLTRAAQSGFAAAAVLLGALVIDEPITASMVFGCAVILLGTALSTGLLKLPTSGR